MTALKNKAVFENFHPGQQFCASEFSPPAQKPIQTNSLHHNMQASTAMISKLSQYQKMSAGPQKRSYVRQSSKKVSAIGSNELSGSVMAQQAAINSKISIAQLDEKASKNQSSGLIKMPTNQAMSSQQLKELHSTGPAERKSNFKSSGGGQASKKAVVDAQGMTTGKLEQASTAKKLIFSFKKNEKQKVTPPNVSNSAAKQGVMGHHRRVQSHGTQSTTHNLEVEQQAHESSPSESPEPEKSPILDMFGSEKTTTVQPSGTNETRSQDCNTVFHSSQFAFRQAQKKDINLQDNLIPSRSSKNNSLGQSSVNGSREQVSIISLNSFSRSTPKFTQVMSMPTSVINQQAIMSRTGHLPSKMLSPQSQTQIKQTQLAPAKSISIRDKKVLKGNHPSELGATTQVTSGAKKVNKMQKSSKLRLKQPQPTMQASVQPIQQPVCSNNNAMIRAVSPNGVAAKNKTTQREAKKQLSMPAAAPAKIQQPSSRNQERERVARSSHSIKEPSSMLQSCSVTAQGQSEPHTKELRNSPSKDFDLEAVGEEFPLQQIGVPKLLEPPTKSSLGPGKAQHQKSTSLPNAQQLSQPGLFNMYMGQVKQLKKQRIMLQKPTTVSNSAHPTHYINLNSGENQFNHMSHGHASMESLQKNSSLLPANSKPKMSVTGKAPNKLHLTMNGSDNTGEKSHLADGHKSNADSISHEHDMAVTTEVSARPLANQVPLSLTNIQAQGFTQKRFQTIKPGVKSHASSISGVEKLGTHGSSHPQLAQLTSPAAHKSQPQQSQPRGLTIKHKQLAKAIKQHHQNIVKHQDNNNKSAGSQVTITTKTLSSSHKHGRLGDESSHAPIGQQIRSSLSPKQQQLQGSLKALSSTVLAPTLSLSPATQQPQNRHIFNQLRKELKSQRADDFISERKRQVADVLDAQSRSNPKFWIGPDAAVSAASEDHLHMRQFSKRDPKMISGRRTNSLHNQEAIGQNSQQISASIIKKIQNNYQVQVTNTGYDSCLTTASVQALNSITQKIKNETITVLPYLHALQEIQEVYPQNQPLNTLLSQIHQGISTMILSKEDQIQQSHALHNNQNKLVEAKELELKVAVEQIQHLERNEQENRRCVQQMTEQIDERDFKIDKLEQKIMEHQKRARLMFKKQMAAPSEKLKVSLIFDGNCSELEKQSEERRKVFIENEELQAVIDELNEDMAYGKQRENKLMFFLYILKQMGYPISEVFEREIKDVPTNRFSKNFDDEYKVMHAQLWKERKQAKKEAKLVQQNGFGIDRDEVLIESVPKSDRLVPPGPGNWMMETHSISRTDTLDDESDVNFHPLQVGPTLMPEKPEIVPYLDINKVLIVKHRRAKGLSVSNLINRTDSMDQQSQSSEESLDSRGRPKRCPKPRLHKKILDNYGITTGARNILALENKVFKERYQDLVRQRSNSQNLNLESFEELEDDLRFTLNSHRAKSIQSQRI